MRRVQANVAPEIVAQCRPSADAEGFVCPEFDYVRFFETYADPASWASRLPRYGIGPADDVIATLTKNRVFSLGEAADAETTRMFRSALAELHIPLGYE
jgi:hypothetical protein